ncbi:unnamed protein product [Clonostachys rosea f. rosea IK726]|uniref:SMODS and SLOG-associating 2TM effector domain-containing protein n=2 Tax=Bionectria ochroleuca TaxID=29856 RepID=A0A0B7K8Y0_BIOOC|nr:unnamed protein product [Clonostachys rosea f. rosea IK726]
MSLAKIGHGLINRIFPSERPSPEGRAEQGYPPHDAHNLSHGHGHGRVESPLGDSKDRRMTVMTLDPSALIPPEDKLLIFRTLTGIDTVPAVSNSGHAVRSAANIGLYTRVVRNERFAKKGYRVSAVSINGFLGLQIIIGAALTALGAANGSYNAIMGLGVFNTIIAGLLAYIKGSGMPNKFKRSEYEWRKVREYIEQRERELCLADSGLDVYYEVKVVEEMYYRVREELLAGIKEPAYRPAEQADATRPKSELGRSQSVLRRQSMGSEPPYAGPGGGIQQHNNSNGNNSAGIGGGGGGGAAVGGVPMGTIDEKN